MSYGAQPGVICQNLQKLPDTMVKSCNKMLVHACKDWGSGNCCIVKMLPWDEISFNLFQLLSFSNFCYTITIKVVRNETFLIAKRKNKEQLILWFK